MPSAEAIYLEKLVKQTGKTQRTSMWVQNMQLAARLMSTAPFQLLCCLFCLQAQQHKAFYSLVLTGITTLSSRAAKADGSAVGIFHGFSFSASRLRGHSFSLQVSLRCLCQPRCGS